MRDRGRRRGLEELDVATIGPAIESNTELFPNRTNVSFTARRRVDRAGADLRARGGGDALLGHRGQRRRGRGFLGGGAVPLVVELDGGRLEVAVSDQLDVTLTGTAARVYAGELDAGLVDALGSG